MALSEDNKKKIDEKRIDVLLSEYQACQSTRNHYNSVRWTKGSIFIATSFALLGFSFWAEVRDRFWAVNFMAFFSISLFMLWYVYNQYVNPYNMISILRMHEIEQELREMSYNIKLHKSIYEGTLKGFRAIYITVSEFILVFGAWIGRNILLQHEHSACASIILLVCLISVTILHFKHYNTRNWRKEISEILGKRKECKKELNEKGECMKKENVDLGFKAINKQRVERLDKTFDIALVLLGILSSAELQYFLIVPNGASLEYILKVYTVPLIVLIVMWLIKEIMKYDLNSVPKFKMIITEFCWDFWGSILFFYLLAIFTSPYTVFSLPLSALLLLGLTFIITFSVSWQYAKASPIETGDMSMRDYYRTKRWKFIRYLVSLGGYGFLLLIVRLP